MYKAATEATALSYQSLFLMSHDWTVPLPAGIRNTMLRLLRELPVFLLTTE